MPRKSSGSVTKKATSPRRKTTARASSRSNRSSGFISIFSAFSARKKKSGLLKGRTPFSQVQMLAAVAVLVGAGTVIMQTTFASTTTYSLWSNTTATPAATATWDTNAAELGFKFKADSDGTITGVKYYKARSNSGTHTGSLWNSTGTKLATATFTSETRSGWQTVTFAVPVAVLANQTYVASYHTNVGNYSVTNNAFTGKGYDASPLHALSSTATSPNGVFVYGSGFPTQSYADSNYWVDVIFQPTAAATPTPTATPVATIAPTATPAPAPVPTAAPLTSVKAFDTTATISDPAWFVSMYNQGFRLYAMHSTQWGTCTPWANTPGQLKMALDAGLKIAVYTRDPNCWQGGINAAGPYISQLQFFAIDVETDPGFRVTQAMVDGVTAMGVRPMIYSGSGMWSGVMGGNVTTFANVPLWDTDTSKPPTLSTWVANVLSPTPVQYGGWNTSTTMRKISQQAFNVTDNGVVIDLNSVDASFLK
jgi:hypothetical protein